MSAHSSPFVSVVIPALDCEEDVDGCIASLRQQEYPAERFEIIVVDNGSSDRTVAMLEKQNVRCVIHRDRGRSRALNAGLRAACGEIVCTTDMSCRPAPDWIHTIVKCFDDPAAGCVAGDIRLIETHSNMAMRFQARNDYMSPLHAMSRRTLPFLPFADGANASFRRSLFDEIGGFDETFIKGADVEICYRMFVLTRYKLVFCREAVVWEAGESDLAALLRQRFRMGVGWNLLKAKYPAFFRRPTPGNPLQQAYWKARGAMRSLFRLFVRFDIRDRGRLEDATVRFLMSVSQTLGRWYGRRHLKRRNIHPVPLDSTRIASFLGNRNAIDERVAICQADGALSR